MGHHIVEPRVGLGYHIVKLRVCLGQDIVEPRVALEHHIGEPIVGLGHQVVESKEVWDTILNLEKVWDTMCQGVSDLNLKYFILNTGSASAALRFHSFNFFLVSSFFIALAIQPPDPGLRLKDY